jgi:hypothetical protein
MNSSMTRDQGRPAAGGCKDALRYGPLLKADGATFSDAAARDGTSGFSDIAPAAGLEILLTAMRG